MVTRRACTCRARRNPPWSSTTSSKRKARLPYGLEQKRLRTSPIYAYHSDSRESAAQRGGRTGWRPVIAVPTSVGYGAAFKGLAALLGMMNSCASNVSVVNIDNGFGAGYVASLINRL